MVRSWEVVFYFSTFCEIFMTQFLVFSSSFHLLITVIHFYTFSQSPPADSKTHTQIPEHLGAACLNFCTILNDVLN